MSFQSIPTIEEYQFYLDLAFSRAKKSAGRLRASLKKEKLEKSRDIEVARIGSARDTIADRLFKIVEGFPSMDHMTPFYQELSRASMDYVEVKKSLGSVNWAAKQANKLGGQYQNKVQKAKTVHEMNSARKEFYGRISSMLKEIDKNLKVLISARKEFVSFPVVKDMPTICITGFPNVGKTTLLKKITGSEPEIKAYAFTTKRLNLGYATIEEEKVQFIDTPGTLARPNKMNHIERMAYTTMKHAADALIYVWDPTEPFPMESQEKLFKLVKKYGKPIVSYVSKADISQEAEKLAKKKKAVVNTEELKHEISVLSNIN